MGLVKLIKLKKQQTLLKNENVAWRQMIYQNQAKFVLDLKVNEHLPLEMQKHQAKFFQQKMRNYLQGLKDNTFKLKSVTEEIKSYQESPTIKALKLADFLGTVFIGSVLLAGLLSIWL